MEIGIMESIRDDSDRETADEPLGVIGIGSGSRVANGERDTIDGNRTLIDSEIATTGEFSLHLILKSKDPTAVSLHEVDTLGSLIDMPLDDMTIETPIDAHAAFDIHLIADFKIAEIRTIESFADSCNSVGAILRETHHSKADAIMRHTLIDGELIDERTSERDIEIILHSIEGDHTRRLFNNA